MHTLHLIFTSTNSKMGAFLRLMTHKKVNHVSVKLDDEVMYSYRRETPHNIFSGRFGEETLEGMRGGYPSYVEQIDIPLSEEEYLLAKARIGSQQGHRYDFVGCVLIWLGIGAYSKNKMICSSFAAYVLDAVLPMERRYNFYAPDDLRRELIRKKNSGSAEIRMQKL